MITGYNYEVRSGKQLLGHVNSSTRFQGNSVFFPTISELKRDYGRTYELIKVPIAYLVISDNGVDYTTRRYLDVRRKSARQIELILRNKY